MPFCVFILSCTFQLSLFFKKCYTCVCAVVAKSNYGLIQAKQEKHCSVKTKKTT